MAKRIAVQPALPGEGLTVGEVAEAVEARFGAGSLGHAPDDARATLVHIALYLVVKDRTDGLKLQPGEAAGARLVAKREVRRELAGLLGVSENEVLRLYHRAAGVRARDRRYRAIARALERRIAAAHGMEA